MADPFSIAASVIGLVAISATATKNLHRLIVSMRQAPDVVLSLSNELSDLTVVLLETKTFVDEGRKLPEQSRERIAILLSRIEPKIDEVEKLVQSLHQAGSSSVFNFSRLAWVNGKTKAKSLQRDLRLFRLNLAAILAANTVNGILRIETALQNLTTVTQQAQIHHVALQADTMSEVSRNHALISGCLDQVTTLIKKREQTPQPSESLQSILPNDLDEKTTMSPVPSYSAYEPFGAQVIGYRLEPCAIGCPCHCHQRRHFNSPAVLNKFMGLLFLGYASNIMPRSKCTESSCYQPSKFSMQLAYYFPSWFMSRALVMAIKEGSFESIQASISLHKIVPQTADVFDFCAAGDVSGIHSLFKMGRASPNDTYRAGGSPLLNYAIERGQVQVVTFLLNAGADPLLEDGLGRSAIDFACINVFADTFGATVTKVFQELLLPASVLANRQLTSLHRIVVGLLDKNLEIELPYLLHTIDDQALDGKTALSLAARRGDLEAVNLLLRYGANPNIYDNRGNGPLHSAACSTNWRCIPALLEHGANATHNNSRNESPVNYALFYADDPHYLQPLLDAGANVNNRDYNGDTPLITATYRAPPSAPVAAFGAVNCVDYLIRRGANVECSSSQGNTPILNAVIHNNVGTLRVLLQYGADYHVRNLVGDTILHLAARHGDLATLRLLTDTALRDLDLDALNDDGYTAKETTRQRVSNIRGFDKAFDELLLSIATEIAMDSMVASTVITVSSYEDAIEYQVALRTPPEPEREDIPYSTPLMVLPVES